MAWVRNSSGSTFAAVLAHASVNASLGVLAVAFPDSLVETTNWWGLGIILAAAVVALLTRGHLGAGEVAETPLRNGAVRIAHGALVKVRLRMRNRGAVDFGHQPPSFTRTGSSAALRVGRRELCWCMQEYASWRCRAAVSDAMYWPDRMVEAV